MYLWISRDKDDGNLAVWTKKPERIGGQFCSPGDGEDVLLANAQILRAAGKLLPGRAENLGRCVRARATFELA